MARFESKSFSEPDEVQEFTFGQGQIVEIADSRILRLSLQPGWRWSEHVQRSAGTDWCEAPHFLYVISGRLGGRLEDGTEFEIAAGSVNWVSPGHDMWVVGDEAVEAIDWAGGHAWGRNAAWW